MTDRERPSELRALLGLAGPLVASHLGNQMMSVVDTIMVGRLGAHALAGTGIGNAIYMTISIVGVGIVMGLDPLLAQAAGAGEGRRARRILDDGLRVAVWTSLPLMALVLVAPSGLHAAGIDDATAREVRRYLLGRFANVLPFLVFIAQRAYLQAHSITRPIVVAMVVANVTNFVGNALLIYGDRSLVALGLHGVGLPALGVLGSGLSSTAASALSVLVLAAAIRRVPVEMPAHAVDAGVLAESGLVEAPVPMEPASASILSIGVPLGLQLLAEVGAFAAASVLSGRMSAVAAAAYQVAITLASATFCVTLGIGAATSVRVGRHIGAGDARAARHAGLVGLGASACFMSCSATVFLAVPRLLARIGTSDNAVLDAAVPLVMIAAVFQLSDGTQATAAGALRGAGDTRASLTANLLGHYLVGLPLAVALGFGLHRGAPGLWWGLSAGLTAVAAMLVVRFLHITRGDIARV